MPVRIRSIIAALLVASPLAPLSALAEQDIDPAVEPQIALRLEILGVPLIGIKAVTDIVDGSKPTTEEFLENLHTAAGALMENLRRALAFLDGKSVGDLA